MSPVRISTEWPILFAQVTAEYVRQGVLFKVSIQDGDFVIILTGGF